MIGALRSTASFGIGMALLSAAPMGQVFRSETNAVTVSVSVMNGRKPVAGLTAKDFELTDNGIPQTLTAPSIESLPIDVTLVLDLSESMLGSRLEGLRASTRQIASLLRPTDTIRVIGVQHIVKDIIARQPGNSPIAVESLNAQGSTALHDGLISAFVRRNAPDRRQLIISVTDGRDTASFAGRDVVEAVARRVEATLQMLVLIENYRESRNGVRLPGQVGLPAEENLTTMVDAYRQIAESTGGEVFAMDPRDSLSGAFKDTLEQFRQAYVLRYSPHGVAMPGWHDITVRLTKSGRYDVRARKGYFGTGLSPTATGTRGSPGR